MSSYNPARYKARKERNQPLAASELQEHFRTHPAHALMKLRPGEICAICERFGVKSCYCFECHRMGFDLLGSHVVKFHKMSREDYKTRHGYNAGTGLAGPITRSRVRQQSTTADHLRMLSKARAKSQFAVGHAPVSKLWQREGKRNHSGAPYEVLRANGYYENFSVVAQALAAVYKRYQDASVLPSANQIVGWISGQMRGPSTAVKPFLSALQKDLSPELLRNFFLDRVRKKAAESRPSVPIMSAHLFPLTSAVLRRTKKAITLRAERREKPWRPTDISYVEAKRLYDSGLRPMSKIAKIVDPKGYSQSTRKSTQKVWVGIRNLERRLSKK